MGSLVAPAADADAFKQQLYQQLKRTGVVASLKVGEHCSRPAHAARCAACCGSKRDSCVRRRAVGCRGGPAASAACCAPQAQLRTQLLARLQQPAGALAPAAGGRAPDQGACGGVQGGAHGGGGLWRAAMDSLVADHLEARGLTCSLSVFAAEAALPDGGPPLRRADVADLVRLGAWAPPLPHQPGAPHTSLGEQLLQSLAQAGGPASPGGAPLGAPRLLAPGGAGAAGSGGSGEGDSGVEGGICERLQALEARHTVRRGAALEACAAGQAGALAAGGVSVALEEHMARYRQVMRGHPTWGAGVGLMGAAPGRLRRRYAWVRPPAP